MRPMPVAVEGARQGSKYRRGPPLLVRWGWKLANERAQRAAEAEQAAASGSSPEEIWVTGALMVRAEAAQAQKLALPGHVAPEVRRAGPH